MERGKALKYTEFTIICLLSIRLFIGIILTFYWMNFLLLAPVAFYFAAVVGIRLKKRWGVYLTMAISAIDLVGITIASRNAFGFGGAVYDILVFLLAIHYYYLIPPAELSLNERMSQPLSYGQSLGMFIPSQGSLRLYIDLHLPFRLNKHLLI